MPADNGFYFPAGPKDQDGILVTRCPHDGCVFVAYTPVPAIARHDGLMQDGALGLALMALYREHPNHFCTDCMSAHQADRCMVT